MKHQSPSYIVPILLTLLAVTTAFVPLSNSRPIGIPSFSLQMSTKDDSISSQKNNSVAAVVTNCFAAASISMAALMFTGSALPANAVDDVSPNMLSSIATTTTIAVESGKAPSLFEFLNEKKATKVIYSPQEGIRTTSPSLARFLKCKLVEDPFITVNDVSKSVEDVSKLKDDSITLVLNNKAIFATGTVGTITAMYYLSYQYYLNAKKA